MKTHDANTCWVCQMMTNAQRWSNNQMPGFLYRQDTWLRSEYRKHMANGIDKHRMGIRVNAEGTMFFMIDRRDVSMYSVNY